MVPLCLLAWLCNAGAFWPVKNQASSSSNVDPSSDINYSNVPALLNLHRAYFAQALHDRPNDLTNHRYLPSVMATYRSAWRLIQSLRFVWEKEPAVLARISLAWSQALSAAVRGSCIYASMPPLMCLTSIDCYVHPHNKSSELQDDKIFFGRVGFCGETLRRSFSKL
jgi:hypothetical protein